MIESHRGGVNGRAVEERRDVVECCALTLHDADNVKWRNDRTSAEKVRDDGAIPSVARGPEGVAASVRLVVEAGAASTGVVDEEEIAASGGSDEDRAEIGLERREQPHEARARGRRVASGADNGRLVPNVARKGRRRPAVEQLSRVVKVAAVDRSRQCGVEVVLRGRDLSEDSADELAQQPVDGDFRVAQTCEVSKDHASR